MFGGESTSFIDLTDRYSDGHDNTTDHIFQVDYSLPLGQGHNLDLGSKLLLHNATSDSKYYLNDIYNEVYGYNIPNTNIGLQERILLEKACADNPQHYQLIQELLALQKNKVLLMRRYGLQTDLESRLESFIKEVESWLSKA